jgi:5-methylcytosine-specific restriction protein A
MTRPPTQRLRGRAGQAQRLRRLKRTNGLCERCLAAGRTTVATVVDHIKPLAHGGSDEDDNTRNLCDPCHLEVTAEQFGHEVRRGKPGVGADGRPLDRDHPWSAARPVAGLATKRTPRGVESRAPTRPDTAQWDRAQCEVIQSKKFGQPEG